MSSGRRRRRSARGSASWRRRVLAGCGLALLLGGTAVGGFWFWSRRAGERGAAVSIEIRGDEGAGELRAGLESAGLLDEPALFEAFVLVTRSRSKLKAGPHLLRKGLSPAELVARLTRSSSRPAVKLTIPEGFNQFQIAERLEKLELASTRVFLERAGDPERLQALGLHGTSAEGYLFPATYELFVDSDPDQLLGILVREAKRRLQRLLERYPGRLDELARDEGWSERDALTLASIIEKEAADSREHGNIASVFFNRLHDASFRPRRMLQSDATAAYGCLVARAAIETCRDYRGLVSPAMLRDATNPYNTYKHPGLPPGPIANPSESAILSVLAPPDTPYFFFVAGAAKRHVFSRTLSEHERAIVTGVPGDADAPALGDAPRTTAQP
ncbi:MAG TPA: endolytic transglycosylase MltG [Polyangiaceae bacterium]|nr:endolytic transglycosylase MltG [Polyangiaceae bacterium]